MELSTNVRKFVRITLYDGDIYYIPREQEEGFKNDMLSLKRIEIQGDIVAVSQIKSVKRVETEEVVMALTTEQRNRLEARKKEYEANLGKKPEPQAIKNMIRCITNPDL